MKIFAAPLQGYTDSAWRKAHTAAFGPDGLPDAYFAPFLRIEKGDVRTRDLRDLDAGPDTTIPQIIFRDISEFDRLTSVIIAGGHRAIDLNLGCPFPPQCHKGRGAAMIARTDILRAVADRMEALPDISFSVKMRLGLDSPDEWRRSIAVIDAMPLTHITIHPRTARQQYKGELHMDEFGELLDRLSTPVIFNGDIATPADIDVLADRYPALAGVMTGRGLLTSPWLIAEYRSGEIWPRERRISALLAMHTAIFDTYSHTLCGDTQILAKLLPFWEYPAAHLPAKLHKTLRKSRTLAAYIQEIKKIEQQQ